jgi:hypothetical protein
LGKRPYTTKRMLLEVELDIAAVFLNDAEGLSKFYQSIVIVVSSIVVLMYLDCLSGNL